MVFVHSPLRAALPASAAHTFARRAVAHSATLFSKKSSKLYTQVLCWLVTRRLSSTRPRLAQLRRTPGL